MQNENYATKDLRNVNDGKVTSSSSSHPIGTVVGTVGGMAAGVAGAVVAGAAVGSAVGPLGAAVGAVIGAGIGAGTGHEIAAQINPKQEDLYWRENYSSRPYVASGSDYNTYQPAYQYGVDSYTEHQGKSFDEIESDLSTNWNRKRGDSNLEWNAAKPAVRDAYDRLGNPEEEIL
jgi:hypothetical protein